MDGRTLPYVFISHASEDKRERVRPIVQALLREGLRVWIDRPGHGDSHLGFSDKDIERYAIRFIRSGEDFQQAIIQSVAQSGAVLFCLSRAFDRERAVLEHELVAATTQCKLVGCVVDDLPYAQLPDFGLVNGRLHYERVRPRVLAEAIAELEGRDRETPGRAAAPDDLPDHLLAEWEVVRKIKRDILSVFRQNPDLPLPNPTDEEWAAARARLAEFPVSPVVRPYAIPGALDEVLAERFTEPHRAAQFVDHAMHLRAQVNSEGGTDRQILVRPGERLPVRTTPAEEYWSDILAKAGHKSPRTLAALLVAPHAPRFETMHPEHEVQLRRLLDELKSGQT